MSVLKKAFKGLLLFFLWLNGLVFAESSHLIHVEAFQKIADKIGWGAESFDPFSVKEGDVVIATSGVASFLFNFHEKIPARYILVSNGSTVPVTEKLLSFLEDEKIICWFTQNPGFYHPKLVPIPLGVDLRKNHDEILEEMKESASSLEKKHLLYMNFTIIMCRREREPLYEMFKDAPFCYAPSPKLFEEYLIDLGSSCFVLSPRGMGEDCFRTWEALYMGAYPIVKSSPLDPMYEGLPVLIVQDFSEITEEFLLEKYEEMKNGRYAFEKLTPEYWSEKIYSFKATCSD